MTDATNAALAVGMASDVSVEVTAAMTPGHVAAAVLSTPSMISAIEGACRRLVLPVLAAGNETVGIHVCVSHEGVAFVGETVSISVRLSEIDRRKLTFDVKVTGPHGVVSQGTHRRAIVDPRRFGSG